jgi:threo-3-hydroxy-L-aspartate ammonia-lyase
VARSFATGVLQSVHNPDTIADGAHTPSLGPRVTFPIIRELVDGFLTVTDDELISATKFVWERMKLVVEPTGALAIAAALTRKLDLEGCKAGIMISGGNADIRTLTGLFT